MILIKILSINYIFRLSNTILGLSVFYFLDFERASFHVGMIYFLNTFSVLGRVGIDAQMQKSIASSQVIKQDLKNSYIGSTITGILLSILIYLIWSQIFIEAGSVFREVSSTYYLTLLINLHLAQSIMIYTYTNTRFLLFLAVATVKTIILFIAPFLEIFDFNYEVLISQIYVTLLLLYLIFKNVSINAYTRSCLLKTDHIINIFKLYATSLRYFLIISSGAIFWVIFASALASVSVENLGVFRIIGFIQSGIGILGLVLNSVRLGLKETVADPKNILTNMFLITSLGAILSIIIFDYAYLQSLDLEYTQFASIALISIACTCVTTLLHSYLNEHLEYVNRSNSLLFIPVTFVITAGILSLLSAEIYVGYLFELFILTAFYFLLKFTFKKTTSWLEISIFLVVTMKVLSDVW